MKARNASTKDAVLMGIAHSYDTPAGGRRSVYAFVTLHTSEFMVMCLLVQLGIKHIRLSWR